MRLIVAGSRGFVDYPLLEATLDQYVKSKQPQSVDVISGTARGADQMGERWAQSRGYSVTQMPADWDRYGKSAGYRRNEEMAKLATDCFLFWDGKSPGTRHMHDIANRRGIPTTLIVSKNGVATQPNTNLNSWRRMINRSIQMQQGKTKELP